jgi:hypothetical protein
MMMEEKATKCHGVCADLQTCSGSTLAPSAAHKLLWHLRHHGWLRTLRLVTSRLLSMVHFKTATAPSGQQTTVVPATEEVLDLCPGEWVEVKSADEIHRMLDGNGRYKGLLWMANMDRFCGKRYRVRKRLEKMMLESNGEFRRLKHTVLLEGATCENLYGCDRSCFHFWREAWLRRVEADA